MREIKITRKKIKSFRLSIKPTGEINLSVPFLATEKEINDFISKNEEWIEKNMQ